MPTRRWCLAAASLGLAGLAGCLSDDEQSDAAGTTDPLDSTSGSTSDAPDSTDDGTSDAPGSTDDGTTDDGTTDAAAVTVRNPVVRKRVAHYSWPGSTQILAPDDEQFVVATVSGPEEGSPPEFALKVDGETFLPGVNVPGRYGATFAGRGGGSVLQNEHASGYLAFRVPSPLDVDDARIVPDDGTEPTPLPDDELATLSRPAAAFELDALNVPDAVERPEQVDVSLSVTNVADVDGRFLAGVNWPTEIADDDETTVLERDVTAGETTTFSLSLDTGTAVSETTDHPLTIEGSISAERTVEVIADDTTTASTLDS